MMLNKKENYKKYRLLFIALILLASAIFVFYLDWQNSNRKFTFAMLDVGQGDALFIESPTGTQILVDAGPPGKILKSLSQIMPSFDRSIDAIIITNPDQDHTAGLFDILKFYKVGAVFEPGTFNNSKTYQNLENEIKNKEIPNILLKRGMKIDFGDGAIIDVLFPDRDVSQWDTNDGSAVLKVSYGDFSIMATGDATIKTEKIILSENSKDFLQSDILKVGHHGSRGSSSFEFVKAVSPEYAFLSVGENNKYGHPHKETLDIFSQFGVEILRTDQSGTIILKCDKMDICKTKKLKNL